MVSASVSDDAASVSGGVITRAGRKSSYLDIKQ